MSDDPKIGSLSGVARPSRFMRRLAGQFGTTHLTSIDSMIEDAVMVNGVAAAMERALVAGTSKDGKVDMKTAAIHLIREMRKNQR